LIQVRNQLQAGKKGNFRDKAVKAVKGMQKGYVSEEALAMTR